MAAYNQPGRQAQPAQAAFPQTFAAAPAVSSSNPFATAMPQAPQSGSGWPAAFQHGAPTSKFNDIL